MTTSITTRAGKGSPLTHDEVDANFTNLQTTADAALPLVGGTMTGPVTMTGGTVTASTPLIDATQTWNAAGVTFTGWKLNITNTASAAGSLLADWQVGGLSHVQLLPNTLRVYGTYTDSSNYVRASLSSTSTTATLRSETAGTGADDVNLILIAAGSGNIVPQSVLRASGSGVEYQVVDGSNNTTCRYSSTYLEAGSGHFIRWRDNVDARTGSADSGLARNAAGVVEVNNGTAGTFRDLKVRNLLAAGGNGSYVQTPSMTVTNLAAAATAGAGARAFVTDATATTFLSTVAGGGANKVPVVSDGTNWLIG